ncbi:MAG: transporter substrate-binding domain-containing protein [Bacteroides sp.]|nr:transporter substrate-binding domain-containing protein [Bacteroides sp.]
MNKYLKYGIMGVIAVALSALFFTPNGQEALVDSRRNYEAIVQSGTLRAVTEYNSISYHAKEDTVDGLHYELLQAFAKEKGLAAEITPEMSIEKRMEGLKNGTFDILANNVLISSDRTDSMLYTHPILTSRQLLIQRKAKDENDSTHISSLLELANKTVHVVEGSPSIYRIQHLSNEIGDTIYIKEIEKYGQEQLLAMVANGDIDYAICDEGIARKAINDLPQLDIDTAISFSQFYSWGVYHNNTELLDSLNAWLDRYKQTPDFQKLMKKYSTNHQKP